MIQAIYSLIKGYWALWDCAPEVGLPRALSVPREDFAGVVADGTSDSLAGPKPLNPKPLNPKP